MSIGFESNKTNIQIFFSKEVQISFDAFRSDLPEKRRVNIIRNFEMSKLKYFECMNPKIYLNENNSVMYISGLDRSCRFDLLMMDRVEFIADKSMKSSQPISYYQRLEETHYRKGEKCLFEELSLSYEKITCKSAENEERNIPSHRFENFSGSGFVVDMLAPKHKIIKGHFRNSKKHGRVKVVTNEHIVTKNYAEDHPLGEEIKVQNIKEKVTMMGKGDLKPDGKINFSELNTITIGKLSIEIEFLKHLSKCRFEGYGRLIFNEGNWISGYIADNKLAISPKNRFKCLFFGGVAHAIVEVTNSGVETEQGVFLIDYENGEISRAT